MTESFMASFLFMIQLLLGSVFGYLGIYWIVTAFLLWHEKSKFGSTKLEATGIFCLGALSLCCMCWISSKSSYD
jgi:hypothetical protein